MRRRDARTKLVCCTGASNFLGTKNPLAAVRALAQASGDRQSNGERRSLLLVDGAQLVPGNFVDVQALDVDYLSFSFHKMLAPFGVGVLYAKEHLLEASLPFFYGGDMIVDGHDPVELAQALNEAGVESRAGCHCATLAHRALQLARPASCRLSFYLYNTLDEVERAADALLAIVERGQARGAQDLR